MCQRGESDTLEHRLSGCRIRDSCPAQGIRSYKDFWALLDTPPLPDKMHKQGFALQVQENPEEEWGLVTGHGYSDGSVKKPRWFCLASGGMAMVQLNASGGVVRCVASTLTEDDRHVAVNTDMYGMAAAAVYAPEDGELTLWVDCQAVVNGYARLEG